MSARLISQTAAALSVLLLAACATAPHRDLASFAAAGAPCYDRRVEPYTTVVDAHIHARPFGGPAIPFAELIDYFDRTGVRFANLFGIGQSLPVDSTCTYYLDCPGTPVLPSIKNDFVNAANVLETKPKTVALTLSMTFTDLEHPADTLRLIALYDKEYPKMFKWMGEVNLVKQALFPNHHAAVTQEAISHWAGFMAVLRQRHIPLTIHGDLGNNAAPTKYLPLMQSVLARYPDNQIVWAHMGLSKELTTIPPAEHIRIMKALLDRYPNLWLDLSWRVLYDNFFSKPAARDAYVAFINQYSDRILPGTDFVAARGKTLAVYAEELDLTSQINRYLSDQAFRNIALGGNYFRLLGMDYRPPEICATTRH